MVRASFIRINLGFLVDLFFIIVRVFTQIVYDLMTFRASPEQIPEFAIRTHETEFIRMNRSFNTCRLDDFDRFRVGLSAEYECKNLIFGTKARIF